MKGFCFLLVCLIAFSVGLYGQEELTIDDIIDMVQAGLSDSFILQKLRISTLEYPPTVEDLVELRSAGVSERVILALMGVGSRGRLTSSSSAQTRYASEPVPHPEYELFGGYSIFLLDQNQDVRGWNITSTNHFNNSSGDSKLVVIIPENAESDEIKRAYSKGEPFLDVDIHSHARSVPESKLAAGKGGHIEKAGLDPSSANQCSDIRGHPFRVTEGKLRSSKEGIHGLADSPVVVTASIDRETDQIVEMIGTGDIPAADVFSPVQKESGIAPKVFIFGVRHRFGCIPCLCR